MLNLSLVVYLTLLFLCAFQDSHLLCKKVPFFHLQPRRNHWASIRWHDWWFEWSCVEVVRLSSVWPQQTFSWNDLKSALLQGWEPLLRSSWGRRVYALPFWTWCTTLRSLDVELQCMAKYKGSEVRISKGCLLRNTSKSMTESLGPPSVAHISCGVWINMCPKHPM